MSASLCRPDFGCPPSLLQEELEAQLGSQTNVLRRVVEQCKQQEATIEHQRTVIEQQAGVMDQQRAALECSAAAQASGALANVDPEVLQVCGQGVLAGAVGTLRSAWPMVTFVYPATDQLLLCCPLLRHT
jgi:hypothetical protein